MLLGAVRHDRRPSHSERDHVHVIRRFRTSELLQRDRLVAIGRAASAVLLRPGQACVAGVEHLPAPRPTGFSRKVLRQPSSNLCSKGDLVGTVAKVHTRNLEQNHGTDHVAGLEILECLSHVPEPDPLRDHAGEIELALAGPLEELWEVECRYVVAAVRDDDS